jgi:hypothetical protein
MKDVKKSADRLPGVGCDATHCRYNGTHCGAGATCCAAQITVRSENAMRKAETFCSTFEPTATL